MPNQLTQAGNFRGRVVSYGLNSADSGAKSVYLTVVIEEIYHENQWWDWRKEELEVGGDIWIIKKDGSLNERQVRALIDCAGWDGSLVSIAEGLWQPKPIQVVVNEDTYNDETRYRINWINEYDRVPGGGNVSASDAKALQQKYGSQLRALAGNAKRNSTQPTGEPTKPPKTETSAAPQPSGEIPF
jgi:hypothetical protein